MADVRVLTIVKTALFTLSSDSDDPDPDGPAAGSGVSLLGPVLARWAIDVLPPLAQPSSVQVQIYDSGDGVNWLPVNVGDPIGVYAYVETPGSGTNTPLLFQGRIAEVSAANHPAGGVVFTLICYDRLADLTSSPGPAKLFARPPATSHLSADHAIFAAYRRVANHADIDLDADTAGGEPDWTNSRAVELSNVDTLSALHLLNTHDVRDGIPRVIAFDLDPADPTPVNPVEYVLDQYDPEATDALAGVLELVKVGAVWELLVNSSYYTGHDGMVLSAENLEFDIGDWRKARDAQINTVELAGKFRSSTDYPRQVGMFEGASTVANLTASANVTPLPADTQDGDWAWCVITAATGSGSDPITPPEGWFEHPTGPLQQSSTVRSWLFFAELTEADGGTVPAFTFTGSNVVWTLVGAVVTDTDGPDDVTPRNPNTDLTPVPSSASTALTYPSVVPGGKERLAYAVAALRMGTGGANNLASVQSAGWTIESSIQNNAATSRMGLYTIKKRLPTSDPSGQAQATLTASGVNNGVAWAFTMIPRGTLEAARAEHTDLVEAYGRNTRQIDSFLYWRDDAEQLAAELLGERSAVQTGYGITQATIAWETLSVDQQDAWGSMLWPTEDSGAYGRPVAIVEIPDDWRLIDGPAVFGRLMGLELSLDADKVRVALTLRAVATITGSGLTYDGAGALLPFPGPTYATIDPAITYNDLTLVED